MKQSLTVVYLASKKQVNDNCLLKVINRCCSEFKNIRFYNLESVGESEKFIKLKNITVERIVNLISSKKCQTTLVLIGDKNCARHKYLIDKAQINNTKYLNLTQ